LDSLGDSWKNDIFTVFAPNDKAFENLKDVDLSDASTLEGILQYHTIDDEIIYAEDLGCNKAYTMANDQITTHQCTGSTNQNLFQVGGGNADKAKPKIVDEDYGACNGIIHTLNKVILPP